MSDANRVAVHYVEEATYGTTPVDSANWQALRFTGESLGGQTNTTQSNEIRPDRMVADFPKVGTEVQGNVSGEFSAITYDDFLSAVMGSDWNANVLKVGTLAKSFSFEKHFQDIDVFALFKGMRVNTLGLNFEFGGLATIETSFAGNFYGTAASGGSLVGAGSINPATVTPVFNNSADITDIKIDGVSTTVCFQSLALEINANLRPRECLGQDAPSDQTQGSLGATGSFTAYLEDLSLEQKKIDNDPFSLEFTLSDGSNGYTFLLPKLKFGGNTPGASGKDTDVLLEGEYEALYDAGEDSSIVITRF